PGPAVRRRSDQGLPRSVRRRLEVRALRLLFVGIVALLLNSAYLWAFADPTLWYFVQVALHPLLGLAPGIVAVWLIATRRWNIDKSALAGLAISAIGLLLGMAILVVGATTPYRRMVLAHVAISALGATLLTVHFWRDAFRLASTGRIWI